MDKKAIFVKTNKGENEIKSKDGALSGDLKRALYLVDDKSTFDEISKRAVPSLRSVLVDVFQQLHAGGYIRDKNKPFTEPQIVAPKMVTPANGGELDFTNLGVATVPIAPQLAQEVQQVSAAAKAQAELEAAVEAAKNKARAEAEAKAEANAKLAAEAAARNKVEADLKAKQDAQAREQAELKARQELAARVRAEQIAAQAKMELEAAARAKEKADLLARQQQEEVAKAKREAELRVQQEAEAARIKAEQEAIRVNAELAAAAQAKKEAEAARVKAELEAARMKAELDAERVRAESEAKALADERIRQEAEAIRLKQEQEAARLKAEAEVKALAEAKARQETEAARLKAEEEAARVQAELAAAAQAKAEAEAARLKAEQEAARMRAELEAAKVQAELEAKVLAEERARQEKETERLKREQEEARRKSEAEIAAARLRQEQELARIKAEAKAQQEAETARVQAERAAEKIAAESAAAALAQAAAEDASKHAAQLVEQQRAEAEQAALKSVPANEAPTPAFVLPSEVASSASRGDQESQRLADEQARAWAAAEQRAKELAKSAGVKSGPQTVVAPSVEKAPPQRTAIVHRKPMPWGKMTAALCVLLVLAVFLLPYVFSANGYIAAIEQQLSAQLQRPVHIANVRASTLPLPRLQLDKVTLGVGAEVKVEKVVLTFDWLSLFAERKVIQSVEFSDVAVGAATFAGDIGVLPLMGVNKNYPVSRVIMKNVTLTGGEVVVPIFNGEMSLDDLGHPSKMNLKSVDSKLEITLLPSQDRWQISLNAQSTSLPVFSSLFFDELTAKGEITPTGANFVALDGQAYGGFFRGNAKLSWHNSWQLQGRVEAKTIELNKLFPKFGVSGELSGEGNFLTSATKLKNFSSTQQLDGVFTVKKGIVNGIDMVETVRQGERQHTSGGRTHFDELTGNFLVNATGLHVQHLKMTSGILNGAGGFEVNSGAELSGHFSVDLKARAGNSSLVLSGTLTEPNVRIGR